MTITKKTFHFKFLLITIGFALLNSCGSKEDEPEPIKPWVEYEILPGNFSVNSKDITMHEELSVIDYYSDGTDFYKNYVRRSDLPNNSIEFYSIFIRIPTLRDKYNLTINGYGSSVYYFDQIKVRIKGDDSSGFVRQTTSNGVAYSIFEIVIRDTDFLADNVNFEKIVFIFNVIYNDKSSGIEVSKSNVNVEVYADTQSSSSGSNDTGLASFWVNQDYGCGAIDVTIPIYGTQTVTAFFDSSPSCGVEGSANFYNLPYGNYSYSAAGSGCTWSNGFSLTSDCANIQLTL